MKTNKRGDLRGMVRQPPILKAEENGHWKGGVHCRKDGYIMVRKGVVSKKSKGKRYELMHRIVMEKHLGRPLSRSEIVHHKDNDKKNNHPRNLMVMTQAEHASLHLKMRKRNKLGYLLKIKK